MTLDGALIEKKDLKKLIKEAKKNGKLIIEKEKGVFVTLNKMED